MLFRLLRLLQRFLQTCLAVCVAASVTFAQPPPTGGVRGKIIDPSGALVTGASVSLIGVTGQLHSTVTDAEGAFVIARIPVGRYTMRATAAGFAPYEKEDLEITPGRSVTVEIPLGLTVTEQVTIND